MLMTQTSKKLPVFPQFDGIFVLNKPSGPSSAQCLKLFKKLGQKKIGHAGTLDPLASGVLLVLLGQATKLSSYLLEGGKKIYSGVFKLGVETDTWDSQGKVINQTSLENINIKNIYEEISMMKGEWEQEVPPFSAAKYNGQPLYSLARKNLPTPLKTKKIKIFDADVLKIGMPFVNFRITCSSGSYIRSLAHSLGKRLGCGAILQELVREYSHPYDLEHATSLDKLKANPGLLRENLKSIDSALPSWDKILLNAEQVKDARNGISPRAENPIDDKALLYEGETPLALAKLTYNENGSFWKILRGLWN